ncbi:MAG: citrate/2-methylcitrate synthase [Henriciella sp.]
MKWITRSEALDRLGVKPQTLYAYVSRGLITSRPQEEDPRVSLYSDGDISAFLKRRRTGRARDAIAKAAISWGEPVMETAITTVREGRLIYRGRDAVKLAETATLEKAAALLWQANDFPAPQATPVKRADGDSGKARLLNCLASDASTAQPGFGRGQAALVADGARLLHEVSLAITSQQGAQAYHVRLAGFWGADERGADLIRRALVLVADHELNASTFAARVAASTGASLAAAALAGCATLTGPLHGEASARALAYLKAARDWDVDGALAALGSRREHMPGVGHTLYPEGDPRAAALLGWLKPSGVLPDAIDAAETMSGQAANIDMALAALCLELGLPDDAPFLLFASGRMVGWIAHAIEQLTSGRLIRPRARYTGT